MPALFDSLTQRGAGERQRRMGFEEDNVFRYARFVQQRLDVRQLLRWRSQKAWRKYAKPLPDQLFFTSARVFFSSPSESSSSQVPSHSGALAR